MKTPKTKKLKATLTTTPAFPAEYKFVSLDFPIEPSLQACAAEILGYVKDLEDLEEDFASELFGDGRVPFGEGEGTIIPTESLKEKLAMISERLASLVGANRTLLQRVRKQ